MWDKWKKKIEHFIWKEVEVEVEVDDIETKKPQYPIGSVQSTEVEAKIAYQYPKETPFRFPVIPDSTEKVNPTEIPAYQRRAKKTREYDHKINNEVKDNNYRRVKDEKKPFQPTNVPSPIYGFHPRRASQKEELENVPAFMRKQQYLDKKESETLIEENKQQEQPLFKDQPAATVNTEEQVDISTSVPKQDTDYSFAEDNWKEQKTEPNQLEVDKQKSKQKPYSNTSVVASNNTSSVPYNVMMTPKDKKRLQDKRDIKKIEQNKESSASVPLHLLDDPEVKGNENSIWVEEQQQLLEKTLKHFNVRARVVNATQGPAVTRFEVQPEMGVKVSKVKNLSDDLKLNMSARDIRIEAPIPGKNTIGIEVPNPQASMVGLQEILETEQFKSSTSPLTIALGLNIDGSPIVTNIQKMPHGMIAGATGSGKSVCINTILLSLLYKANHEEVKFILIDPKMVELAPYNGIPHLISPVITDVKAATAALKWAVNEMEERYDRFVQEGVRDIKRLNQKMEQQNRLDEKMPYIVIIIDELADLMMVSPQDVEDAICRIAQKARACGIHLLLATQRPSVDVITGLIKANIPTRIAFSVSSQVDSRTIIDSAGAEKLLGRGDMLFVENGAGKSIRLQGPFVSDDEIERVTDYVRNIAPPNYLFEQETLLQQLSVDEEEDELLQEAIQFVMAHNSASTSLLQRQFKIGYNRAARLIDALESKGIISGQNGSKPRDVLITQTQLEEWQDNMD
ncbi:MULTISPECIES: DNA translocase FtsK [unclassified Virgibacillus]|uniref:DNA translocase FtsK n=1 Tax=unclassified Virgibacillus TaxID=2620237 RepID=UPI0024DE8906|nr:DNA translocase FtsK [Virgibacillus sp. LDC-1]